MIQKRKDRVQKVQLYRAGSFPPSVTTLDNIQSVSSPFDEFVVLYDRLGSWTVDNILRTQWETIRARACGASVMPGLEESISHDTSPPPTRALMSDGDHAVTEQVKKYVFRSRKTQNCAQGDEGEESLEILIPEVRGDDSRGCPATLRPANSRWTRATGITCCLVRSFLDWISLAIESVSRSFMYDYLLLLHDSYLSFSFP